MTYQIYAIIPTYDNRDAIVGTTAHIRPSIYLSPESAFSQIPRLAEAHGDDIAFVVVPKGGSPYTDAVYPPVDLDDSDFPF